MRDPQSIADPAIHLPVIDGLPGVAILMVLAVHTLQRVGNVGLQASQFPSSQSSSTPEPAESSYFFSSVPLPCSGPQR